MRKDIIRVKYNDFIDQYNYDKDPLNNIYSIYELTDFMQSNLNDNERIPFIEYLVNDIANNEDLEFKGNLHEITVLNDEETQEFLGNIVSFYHGDNFCESFYGTIYFEEYPNFFEKIDSLEHNSVLSIKGKLKIIPDIYGEYYYLEIYDVDYLKDDEVDII